MTAKIIFSLLSSVIVLISYGVYLRDIFRGQTQPHSYTWLIWFITQGTAVVGLWFGGGGAGALSLTVGLFFIFSILLLSLKRGTKNVTKGDTLTLCAALCAVLVWWLLKSPVLAVVMVTVIDLVGYVPSIRKTYLEPWSESILAWVGFAMCSAFALVALGEYNWLTVCYTAASGLANLVMLLLCVVRRRMISQPQ